MCIGTGDKICEFAKNLIKFKVCSAAFIQYIDTRGPETSVTSVNLGNLHQI